VKTVTLVAILTAGLCACGTSQTVAQTEVQASSVAQATDPAEKEPAVAQIVEDDSSSLIQGVQRRYERSLSVRQEADLIFNILSAEIAGRRGLMETASQNYLQASNSTEDPRVAEHAVKLALFSRDVERANLASERWVSLEPENIEAWQYRVQACMQDKNIDNATVAIEKIVALSDDTPGNVIPTLVDTILQQSDADMGSELLRRLATRYPDSADTQYGIGRFAMSKGERDLALEAFGRALKIDPANVETLLARARLTLVSGDSDLALEPVAQYVSDSPDDFTAQIGLAKLLMDTGKFDQASERLEVIAKRFSKDSDALYTIGLMALELKRINSAEKYLTAVVDTDSNRDDAYFYLGRISDSRRDYAQAIRRYQEVQGGEHFFDAQTRAAELFGVIGQIDDGRKLLNTLRGFSDDKAIQIELIGAESRMLNGNDLYEDSLTVLNEGLEQYENDPTLLYARALVADRVNDKSLFVADIRRVIDLEPENGYALNALGYHMVENNLDLNEAEDYLQRAYRLLPTDAAVIDSLGWLYYRQGRIEESLKLLQKAHNILPDPEIAAHLGEVLWAAGDQSAATKVWEEALREAPDDDLLNKVMKKFTR